MLEHKKDFYSNIIFIIGFIISINLTVLTFTAWGILSLSPFAIIFSFLWIIPVVAFFLAVLLVWFFIITIIPILWIDKK
ncbi:MAG: hypothetical protein ACOC1O_00040 [bacterium]